MRGPVSFRWMYAPGSTSATRFAVRNSAWCRSSASGSFIRYIRTSASATTCGHTSANSLLVLHGQSEMMCPSSNNVKPVR